MAIIMPRIKNGLQGYSDPDLLEYAVFVHQKMSANTSLFPGAIPTMPELKDGCDEFQSAMAAAGGGDRVLVQLKNQKRDDLILKMHILSYFVLWIAAGRANVITEAGFKLVLPPSPRSVTKPVILKLQNTDQPGELLVVVKRIPAAAAYSYQYTTDPELKEESWMSMGCTLSKCTLNGLTVGKTYYVRVAVVGAKDQMLYSDVASRMVS